jgi:hypothetical protein
VFGVKSRRSAGRSIATIVAMWVIALNVVFSPFCGDRQPIEDAFGQPICAHHSSDDRQTQHPGGADGGSLCCQCCTSLALIDTSPTFDLPVAVIWTHPAIVTVQILLPRSLRHPAGPPRGPPFA